MRSTSCGMTFAYTKDAEKSLAKAEHLGRTVVSIRGDDWTTVFGKGGLAPTTCARRVLPLTGVEALERAASTSMLGCRRQANPVPPQPPVYLCARCRPISTLSPDRTDLHSV